MKTTKLMLVVCVAVMAGTMVSAAQQSESLGDYARSVRKEKRPPANTVYTNDNLPTNASISVVGPPPASATPEEKPAAKTADDKAKSADKDKEKDAKAAESKAPKDEQGWRDQLADQKKKIADLEHEADLLQREYKLRVAEYYADAGSQLRDPKKWADDDAKYRADITDKQKQLDEAKSKLQEMEEDARKAGVTGASTQ
jgi:hypothetical protein